MRILLTAVCNELGEAPQMDLLAEVLSGIGHQVDIFMAPENATFHDNVGYHELKRQLKRTVDLVKPDVIECSDVDVVAYALGDLGYAYIVNMADRISEFKLKAEEDNTQNEIIRKAGFIFTENEKQKKNLATLFHIDEKKLVTMPISNNGHLVAERLAYYQQMLVRHSLH